METRQSVTPFVRGTPLTEDMVLVLSSGGYTTVAYVDPAGTRRVERAGRVYPTLTDPTHRYHRSQWIGALVMDDPWPADPSILDNQPVNYFPYPEDLIDWPVQTAFPGEPVNQAPVFLAWREHLTVLSHDLPLGHRFDRLALRDSATRRFPGQPSLTSTEDQIRNGNITQHTRETLGWLWQQVHVLGGMSHTDDWQAFHDWLSPIIEGYCACFGRRGALDRIHIGHDYQLWEEALRQGKRFIPDFSVKPFGIIEIPDVFPVTNAVSVVDIHNFGNAVDFFSISDEDQILDVWPDGLDSTAALLVSPEEVPLPNPASSAQQDLVNYWQQQWHNLAVYTDYDSPAGIRAYRAYVEIQLLAVLRNDNWSNLDNIRKTDAAKWDAFDYAELSDTDHPIIPVLGDRSDFWFGGYQYWDGTALVRDALPQDSNDPFTFPIQAAMNQADPRVSTYVVVVDRDEVDRTASGRPSEQPWNVNLGAAGNPTGDTTGTPASEYWQGRIDAILGAYP